jgi:hypothetical protein
MTPPYVCGEVGILADENAQRLCSIFSEAAMNCLVTLRDLSEKHGIARFNDMYKAGLTVVPSWTSDVVREEVMRLEAQYPETRTIFHYVYILLIGEVGDDATIAQIDMPLLEEAYHVFLRRVCASSDVMKGRSFFQEPLLNRRVVFLDCFRNSIHDILRRRTRGRPAATPAAPAATPAATPAAAAAAPAAAAPTSLRTALRAVPAPSGTATTISEAAASLFEGLEEDDDSSPKTICVSASPCFFEDDITSARRRSS